MLFLIVVLSLNSTCKFVSGIEISSKLSTCFKNANDGFESLLRLVVLCFGVINVAFSVLTKLFALTLAMNPKEKTKTSCNFLNLTFLILFDDYFLIS